MKQYVVCRFCSSALDDPVIDLGMMSLAGGFLTSKKSFIKEKFYPLQLCFCRKCFLLQTNIVIDAKTLFENYFYHSSAIKTLVQHFEEIADEILRQVQKNKKTASSLFIVEIGCNDGSFLLSCLKNKFKVLGIDPAVNVVKPLIKNGLPIINDYFTENAAEKIVNKQGQADVIFSANTLAHIEDMHDVFRGIKNLLKPDGMLIFEIHYAQNLIQEMQYDMIYHEHQYYYTLHAIQSLVNMHGMEIFDVKKIEIHGGSLRVYAQHARVKKVHPRVKKLLEDEKNNGLLLKKTYQQFNIAMKKTKQDLLQFLDGLLKQNKKIAGYGASGRGTIVMNYCGLDKGYIDYVIDDSPAKINAYMSGTHQKIVSANILNTKERPDYIILFAWSFWREIQKKNSAYIRSGGKFVIPLPEVKIIQ